MRLISGPALAGFWWFFEDSRGDATTPEPYQTVTPSRVGKSLLPFPCPKCSDSIEIVDLVTDARPGRGNTWCPKCGWRFHLNRQGAPLATSLAAGAVVAPAMVS